MKNVILLDEDDMERISGYLHQTDIAIGDMYNKSIPSELKTNICEINCYVQELGRLLNIWD